MNILHVVEFIELVGVDGLVHAVGTRNADSLLRAWLEGLLLDLLNDIVLLLHLVDLLGFIILSFLRLLLLLLLLRWLQWRSAFLFTQLLVVAQYLDEDGGICLALP